MFEKLYEDNVSGKISDERFSKLSVKYDDEQKSINEKMAKFRTELDSQRVKNVSVDMFISMVQKYTRAKKLTPQMVNELIEKIEVFQSEKLMEKQFND